MSYETHKHSDLCAIRRTPGLRISRRSQGFVLRGSQRLRMLADSFHHLHRYSVYHSARVG